MEETTQEKTHKEIIADTIAALIEIAGEAVYRERVLATGTPSEVKGDLLEQPNEQVNFYRKELEKVIKQKVGMIDQLVQFREKLKMRHQKLPDNVLEKYDEFFNLKDA